MEFPRFHGNVLHGIAEKTFAKFDCEAVRADSAFFAQHSEVRKLTRANIGAGNDLPLEYNPLSKLTGPRAREIEFN
jgi:hypothetical protein